MPKMIRFVVVFILNSFLVMFSQEYNLRKFIDFHCYLLVSLKKVVFFLEFVVVVIFKKY